MTDEKKADTVVLFAGSTDFATIGKQISKEELAERAATYPVHAAPVRLTAFDSIPISFVAAGPAALHALAGAADGRLFAWGRNDKGQLGLGDLCQRNKPTVVDLGGGSVVAAAAGKSHTLIALADGASFACGNNTQGQLGLGSVRTKGGAEDLQLAPARVVGVEACTAVAAGVDFSLWLAGGAVWSAGHPQHGVLGHGTDHEYNSKESSVKLKYTPQPTPRRVGGALAGKAVTRLAAGAQHALAITDDGGAYTWGNGGYGRLGHTVQQDEFAPRLVEGLTGRTPADPAGVACAGTTSSYCAMAGGQLMAWGKLKVSGDNTMRPFPVTELAGWTITAMASGGATFACAATAEDGDRATVAWGHALHAELGYGPGGKKSSAKPDVVPSLGGVVTRGVAMGGAFSLFLVEKGEGDAAAAVDAHAAWASSAPDAEEGPPPPATAPAGKRKGGGGGGGARKK